MTTSGWLLATFSSPSAADGAVSRVVSGSWKARRKKCRMEGSSSITSRVGMAAPLYSVNAVSGSLSCRLTRTGYRQAEKEAGAARREIISGQAAAVVLGDALGHRNAQPDAGFLAADK